MKHINLALKRLFVFFFLTLNAIPFIQAEDDYIQRIRTAELRGDKEEVSRICREWYASGQFSPGKLDWCFNMMMSLEDNAILITQNDHDTYPVWMLQQVFGIRQDVMLWSLPLLEQGAYRKHFKGSVMLESVPDQEDIATHIGSWLNKNGNFSNTPIFISVLVDRSRLNLEPKKLYLTGLAFKFTQFNYDNIAVLRYNYEQRFRLNMLDLNWNQERAPEVLAQLNLNYIPAFKLLYEHYKTGGELEKAAMLEYRCMNIAREGNREKEVSALFYEAPATEKSGFKSTITARELDKRMKKVSNNVWFSESEVSNAQYEQFLQDLLRNKAFDLLDTCKTHKTNWRDLLPLQFRQLSDKDVFEHGHPDDPKSPVQNLSYEAALAYCSWLTTAYNNDLGKKKFKKVRFRLPDKAEWEAAALGGFKQVPYPWGGYFVRNNKGCYLGNFFSTEPCGDCDVKDAGSNDGGFFTVNVNTYYPNNFGLYNMSGNVAEMVAERGIAKGGSWEDLPHLCQVNAEKKYDQPSPAIGFRVVMEIIEP